jgi:hypothetical protein
MLNLFQHLIESDAYETLNQVQGDRKGFMTQSHWGGEVFLFINVRDKILDFDV